MDNKSYDFDRIVERTGTWSLKYDSAESRHMPSDVLPMWVADMDFPTAPEIITALKQRADHGIFGYSEPDSAYFTALRGWFASRHNYHVQPEWLVQTPGVVFALAMCVSACTNPGDSVLIQPPVYYPFFEVIRDNNRVLIENPLVENDRVYTIDFDDFEKKIVCNNVKLFLLCNPHNPVGRVWDRDDLLRLGEICLKHGVIVVSDEIHCDFTFGKKHVPFAALKPEFADITITCTSPSKTFNLAALQIANIFIKNPELRRNFKKALDRAGYSQAGVMGLIACRAAYEHGGDWAGQLTAYLAKNIAYLNEYLAEKLPLIKTSVTEGTYLCWLDFRRYNQTEQEINARMRSGAKLWLDRGGMFGKQGEGFQRVNIACPRETLRIALDRLYCEFRT